MRGSLVVAVVLSVSVPVTLRADGALTGVVRDGAGAPLPAARLVTLSVHTES
jgi:hypothetical protein